MPLRCARRSIGQRRRGGRPVGPGFRRACTIRTVRIERFEFSVDSVEAVPDGWRLEGEPGYHPRHWARPGERFRLARTEHGRRRRDVELVVVELTESYAIVRGTGGDLLRPDDIVSGERSVADLAETRRAPAEAAARLAEILNVPPSAESAGNGDFLFWHVQPGTAPDEWPVMLKEEGPLWEQYGAGFATALANLLTGEIQSEYLSHWLGGPHSYGR